MSLTKVTYSMIDGAPVNVLDFGAYNDGTNAVATTAAIQAALDYLSDLPDLGGVQGQLYFPKGSYAIASTINIPSNVKLIGNGKNFSTQLNIDSGFTGTYAFTIDGELATDGYMFRVGLYDLVVDGTNFPSGQTLILIRNAYTVRFDNVFIRNTPSTAVEITTSGSGQVNDIFFSGCSIFGSSTGVPYGIKVSGSNAINQVRVSNCDVENFQTGVYLDGTAKVSIDSLYAERVSQGIDCRQVDPGYATIVSPTIFAGPGVGVSVGFGTTPCDNTTIIGGYLNGGAGGLYLGAATRKPKNLQVIGTSYNSIVDAKNWVTNLINGEPTYFQETEISNQKTVSNGVATDIYKITINNVTNEAVIADVDLFATLAGASIWSAKYRVAATWSSSGVAETTVTEYAKTNVDSSAANYTLGIVVTAAVVGLELTIKVTQTLGGTLGSAITDSVSNSKCRLINNTNFSYIQAI